VLRVDHLYVGICIDISVGIYVYIHICFACSLAYSSVAGRSPAPSYSAPLHAETVESAFYGIRTCVYV
jgi:hypothetical protein